ncbi:translation initiation factor IF-2-like [Passer montanus]|uniref:translation initiation factor IF-2-like n=1 Tax=Passer montanus TaxID=9160 RepID=UPI00195F46E4|nr:translation initiation factor IF-2-like [Passer montanus]
MCLCRVRAEGPPVPIPPGFCCPHSHENGEGSVKGGSRIGTAAFTRHPLPVGPCPAPGAPFPTEGLSLGMRAGKAVLRACSGGLPFSDHFLVEDFQPAGPSPLKVPLPGASQRKHPESLPAAAAVTAGATGGTATPQPPATPVSPGKASRSPAGSRRAAPAASPPAAAGTAPAATLIPNNPLHCTRQNSSQGICAGGWGGHPGGQIPAGPAERIPACRHGGSCARHGIGSISRGGIKAAAPFPRSVSGEGTGRAGAGGAAAGPGPPGGKVTASPARSRTERAGAAGNCGRAAPGLPSLPPSFPPSLHPSIHATGTRSASPLPTAGLALLRGGGRGGRGGERSIAIRSPGCSRRAPALPPIPPWRSPPGPRDSGSPQALGAGVPPR